MTVKRSLSVVTLWFSLNVQTGHVASLIPFLSGGFFDNKAPLYQAEKHLWYRKISKGKKFTLAPALLAKEKFVRIS